MKTLTQILALTVMTLGATSLQGQENSGSDWVRFCPDPHLRATNADEQTALDHYIAESDSAFQYRLARTVSGKGYTAFVLEMISQNWRSEDEVNRTTWKHWMTIIKPDRRVEGDLGLLFIGGGSNRSSNPPDGPDDMLVQVALGTGSVVCELKMVPNQPLVFNDGKNLDRYEDAIIAYTWDKFLRTGEAKWLARFPMTKSAVRAMDTVTHFMATEAAGDIEVDRFVVAGGSKRGWTTWTTGAVDSRVAAICPIVIDMLNMTPSFQHHYRTYGFFAPAVTDYVEAGIMDWMGRQEFVELEKLVEPFSYRSRLTMPKLVLNASGDQFFLPDSSRFYWDALEGEKNLRYVPNADHSMKGTDAAQTLAAFFQTVQHGKTRPKYSWERTENQSIIARIHSDHDPIAVKVWSAENPDARDFRKDIIGEAWSSRDLKRNDDGSYVASVEEPEKGFRAFFIEFTFKGLVDRAPLKVTTGVQVVPDVEPFEDYQPKPIPGLK